MCLELATYIFFYVIYFFINKLDNLFLRTFVLFSPLNFIFSLIVTSQ